MRSLLVYVDRTLVGTLSEENNLWVFEYAPEWVGMERSFDLSPALPRHTLRHEDGGTLRPVQWYFDNLLPEELLRQAIAKEAGIKDYEDAFALLEYLGAESAGSLTLLPDGIAPPEKSELIELSDEMLSHRIQSLPKQTLSKSAPKRMSLAGAQHKLLVVLKKDALYEPVGATPSTYILKPDHPEAGTYPASVFNEYFTMRLADAAGLQVPKVAMRYVPEPVYLIERFDREVKWPRGKSDPLAPPDVRRLHVIDACQLLNKARTFKHSGATLEALVQIVEATTVKIQTRAKLFRWLVFNILVGNDDCHLKNLSFHVHHDAIELAPHYDLLSTGAYHTKAFADENGKWNQVPMAFPLPGAKTFGDVTQEAVLAAADVLGVPRTIAQRIVMQVTDRVDKTFEKILAEHEELAKKAPASRAANIAIESRLLRVVHHITLRDMIDRLTH
ncbi:serine/threonine-protein kinase HipA [Pelomonas saccharophila]|uniref:Serine/threonine-protein kinase HipA n=1 Tax=Roseateles saccharophilus TaxID=304 RepID=A0ABU1YTT9_ROSSA|nr:serine/threonine-protein kinase HipA [Roseateles saccharophilus]